MRAVVTSPAMTSVGARPTFSDAELLVKIAAGELKALGALFDRYEPDVKRFIARMGVGPGDVNDLVQLTFLDVTRAAASFDGRASARNWLLGIAAMIVRRYRRSLLRVAKGLLAWANEPVQSPETPGRTFELRESARRAAAALARLSAKKREVFVMVVLEGVSGEEAARALGIPVATVWTRLHHARRELRAWLTQDEAC